MGKFIPSISHNYSTVDPSCAVITNILQWLYGHVVFAKIIWYVAISQLLYGVELAQLSQKFCSGHTATDHRGIC